MTKAEEYAARAAESLAAAEAATTEAERMHHRRAHSIFRKLIANLVGAEERAAARAPSKPIATPSRRY
ncbi:hypothetical protein PQ455_14225 [Sphingomonas naphthae]|uniref:Uncharacterized protein n=1 Tax=Sphingomonas naphthae TaxID=1813468 RepID=A0ABY7THU4_9SPHN|nr:hypothetical protein [Sphingomonas naphthae]WCT72783.1 hypothetical protein PQ455_14225 [Sphingomonas naphthae]